DGRPPVFVAHEFVLTDGAGHDYGPHHEALREALYRTDRRIGIIIDLLKRRGLYDSTLFIVTSDHGMAAQRVELKANPAREPLKAGIRGVFAEPMIYLRDLRVELERTRDLRNLRVTVLDNDHLPEGDHPPIAGARIAVEAPAGAIVAEATTPDSGMIAIPTPPDLNDVELTVRVEHPDFNPRTIRGDGAPLGPDLRAILYGNGAGR
ncbi:MAG: alkaline phosphatase family protein, partial [Candidatus Binataceae bacterium]